MNETNKKPSLKTNSGFSLIELLVVVVIIGIIAAIAIPNLLAARMAANEASAISSMRVIHSAEITYQASTGNGDFAGDVPKLQAANLLDLSFKAINSRAVVKSGYFFNSFGAVPRSAGRPAWFGYMATPRITSATSTVKGTGTREFAISLSGVIYTAPSDAFGVSTIYPTQNGKFYYKGQIWNGTLDY